MSEQGINNRVTVEPGNPSEECQAWAEMLRGMGLGVLTKHL